LLPRATRKRDGQSMLRLFERVASEACERGVWRLLGVWLGATSDLVVHALRERLTRKDPSLSLAAERKANMLDSLMMDVRQSVRELYRRPVFALLAGATFALGIGTTTAIFSVVHAALLRDLPYAEPDRIVRLIGTRRDIANVGGTLSYQNYRDVASRGTAFTVSSGYDEWRPNLTGGGEPLLIDAAQVNPGFFEVFGVRAAAGRFFLPEEDIDGQDRVVVLSWALWQIRWGGDPSVIGRDIELNGIPHTVVGVAAREFEDPVLSGSSWQSPALWRPFGFEGLPADQQPSRGSSSYVAVARLADGVAIERAHAELATLSTALEAEFPEQNRDVGMTLAPIRETIIGDVRGSLIIVLGAVGFVLAIAAANVGSLLLGRTAERRAEIAVRAALGATRNRIIGRTVVESLVTAIAGGALGILVAITATRWLGALVREFVPRTETLGVNLAVLAFTFATTLVAGLVCSILPAMLAAEADPRASLSETPRGSTSSARSRRFRRGLVTGEVALAVVLLVGAGLLGRTLWNLMRVDVGIDTRGLLTFELAPPAARYPDAPAVHATYDDLVERLRSLPAVQSVALINIAPLTGGFDCNPAIRPDDPDPEERICPQVRTVTPEYFRTAGVEMVAGRPIEAADRSGSRPVAVITEAMANALWPGEDAIGRQFFVIESLLEVVGVASDVKHLRLEEAATPMVFLARDQGIVSWHGRRMTVMVRTSGDPLALTAGVRTAIADVDAQLPITNLRTMETVVSNAAAAPRFRAVLLGSFATLALLLAAIGIYGVVSYSVAQRTREMAIRLALGAKSGGVIRLVLREALTPVVLGILIGVPAAWALARVLATLLFGVTATDPSVFVLVPLALVAVAGLAAFVPARRAVRTDPMHTLREA
jgi:putative ABC transport system permease protein